AALVVVAVGAADLSCALAFEHDGAETGLAESFRDLVAVAAGFEDEDVAWADVFACPLDESCDGKRVPEAFDFGGGGIAADEGGGAVDVRMHVESDDASGLTVFVG